MHDTGTPGLNLGPQNETGVDELRARLAEAEDTLRAIRDGEVDALLIQDGSGERLYTLRSADAPYRALVEQMQDGAVTMTPDGDIIYCNRRFADLVNLPLQHVMGESIDPFVERADDRDALHALVAGGGGKLRTHLRRHDLPPLEVHISVSAMTLDGVEYRTLIVTDMTSLLKAQRESRSKDEFLAMLAHELRNPLAAVGSAAEVLNRVDLLEPAARRAREIIHRQVSHMARLIDDLLDVGRAITGKISLERSPVDLAEIVRASVTGLAPVHRREGRIELATESVWVLGDPVRLEQIATNLVSNALKFTPADRAVRISAGRDGTEAMFRVEDEGTGIDPELLPRVFDLFVQAEVSSDRARGGLGIGLTLVRRLVEMHGGTIEAHSDGRDRGAVFTIRMPAIEGTLSRRERAASGPAPRKRVLLVDDNTDSREMYGLVLESDGHEVYHAADGDSALSMFRRIQPDVAIIDIGLPGVDGFEVARLLRREPFGRSVTLIALTGYGTPEDRERSRASGFDRHLVKPAAPDALREEMHRVSAAAPSSDTPPRC